MTAQAHAAEVSVTIGSAGDDPARRVQLELGELFRTARSSVRDAAAHVHPELQGTGYAILLHLVRQGGTLSRDLADAFSLDKAAVSRQVAHLEQLGFVQRTPHPEDGRAQLISATAEGERRCQAEVDRQSAALRDLLAAWPERDVDALGRLLARLNAASRGPHR